MFIVDKPFASPALVNWLETNQHPVLANEFARQLAAEGAQLNLVSDGEAAERIMGGERVCSNSETALGWLGEHVPESSLIANIEACKDKELMREKLKGLDPDLFFKGVTYDELKGISYADLPEKLILKPTVGFLSLGVYAVQSQEDWDKALAGIDADMGRWAQLYPENVVGSSRFIIEEMVSGTEYALDMFYETDGTPVIFNIFQHDFNGPEDTSDRLYWCSGALRQEMGELLQPWLTEAGALMGLKNFCVHIELRVDNGTVHVIEFNPLRFAGMGTADVAWYGCGKLAYDVFLNGEELPGFQTDDRYIMSVIMPGENDPADAEFDYDRFAANFPGMLEVRKFDHRKLGAYGTFFLKVPTGDEGAAQMNLILKVNTEDYLIAG